MLNLAFYIVLIVGFYAIFQRMKLISKQYKHLSDENLRTFWNGSLKKINKQEYARVIAHLGLCEACQKRLHEFQAQTNIEDHLISKDEDEV